MIPESITLLERQLLINQYKILAALGDETNVEQNLKRIEILEKGYTGLYPKVFNTLYEEVPISVYTEIEDILKMYKKINDSIRLLPDEEKELLNLASIEFEGFDHNNGMYYHMMSYLVEKMNEHQDYKDRELKSHNSSCMIKYNKMLRINSKFNESESYIYSLSDLQKFVDVLAEITEQDLVIK